MREKVQELNHACNKLEDGKKCQIARIVVEQQTMQIREHIEAFVETKQVDVLMMGSTELSKPGNSTLGSVSSAVSKVSLAHCCVVKSFATTSQ